MNNILAVDCATSVLNISLKANDVYYSITLEDGLKHSENLLPSIEDLLQRAKIQLCDVNLFICTRGPGSFTGLRIAMATLKGLSLAINKPLVSVPTLDLYAFKKNENGLVVPVIDAKKNRFYVAIYNSGVKESEYLDILPQELYLMIQNRDNILLTGPDANLLYSKIAKTDCIKLDNSKHFYGESLIELGIKYFNIYGPDKLDQGPIYIRKSEAEIFLESKSI